MIENGLFFCYYYFNRHITKGGCFIRLNLLNDKIIEEYILFESSLRNDEKFTKEGL